MATTTMGRLLCGCPRLAIRQNFSRKWPSFMRETAHARSVRPVANGFARGLAALATPRTTVVARTQPAPFVPLTGLPFLRIGQSYPDMAFPHMEHRLPVRAHASMIACDPRGARSPPMPRSSYTGLRPNRDSFTRIQPVSNSDSQQHPKRPICSRQPNFPALSSSRG